MRINLYGFQGERRCACLTACKRQENERDGEAEAGEATYEILIEHSGFLER